MDKDFNLLSRHEQEYLLEAFRKFGTFHPLGHTICGVCGHTWLRHSGNDCPVPNDNEEDDEEEEEEE